jgi:putative pyrroloquinoline-quinone binding quinoprotein
MAAVHDDTCLGGTMRIRRLVLAGVLAAVAVAVTGTPAGAATADSWPQYGGDAQHTGTNPGEHAFNSGNIGTVKVVSKAHFGDNTMDRGGPVVSNGRLYVGGTDGTLSVFATAGCGAASCEPLWRASIGDGSIDFTMAVADGLVLVDSPNTHALFAFPAAGCGAATCKPLWTGQMQDGATGSVTASGGMAYVGDISGHLYAFRTAGCGRASCPPVWTGVGLSNEALDTPAVGNGLVYVDTFESTPDLFTGRLLAFRTAGCGTATCKPVWTADLGGPGTAVAVAGSTVFASSSTLFGDGTNTDFHLMAFNGAGCGGTVCTPLRTYFTGGFGVEGGLAIAGNTLLASDNDTTDPQFIGGVFAYPLAGCGLAQCQPTWMGLSFATAPSSPPVVVGDVVLVGKGPASGFPVDSGFFTYNLKGCGASVCQPISLVRLGDQMFYNGAPLAVADHKIFMASTDNTDGHSNVYTAALP